MSQGNIKQQLMRQQLSSNLQMSFRKRRLEI
jgi:hypothetical protein